ncbi:OmpA family protein, partial [Enterovirga sp. CN4-39]|uniref:OmpA family protein n=1 Tax=Enterovirga sp. CN4-39 TaxID=3400910 RepID=UPI003C117865
GAPRTGQDRREPGTAPGAPGTAPTPGRDAGGPAGAAPAREGRRGGDDSRPGGFLPGLAAGAAAGAAAAAGISAVRERRREVQEDGRTVIQEPGRVIVRDRDRVFIRHDEAERFEELGRSRRERRGSETVTIVERPGGGEVITVVDEDGRLVRRIRRTPEGREVVIIDNSFAGPRRRAVYEEVVELPPPPMRIPRERYIVEAEEAPPELIYETLSAPPLEPIRERYTLDQVRYSPALRARMRSVDLNTVNFETGSWEVSPDQAGRLSVIAQAINRALAQDPQEVFLIEGHTDAVGSDIDNLSLSDRRAQSVAELLTRAYRVPPENLTTQGYGEQHLKVNTQDASRENRRVTVRRITPLLQGQAQR